MLAILMIEICTIAFVGEKKSVFSLLQLIRDLENAAQAPEHDRKLVTQ